MLDISISNGRGRRNKASVSQDGFLRVDSKPYYEFKNAVRYFLNSTYGRNMNINAAPSGAADEFIHDGEDNTYWTPSVIAGAAADFDFSSTTQAFTGTQSVEYAAENGEIAQFLRPGGDLDLSPYSNLTGYFYPTDWDLTGTKAILFYGFDTNTGQTVGNSVNLGDYINTQDFDAWQPFTIPLSDMGLVGETIDAVRTQAIDEGPGGAPEGFLDVLEFQGFDPGAISPVEYILRPEQGEYLVVDSLNFTFVREYDSSVLNGTMNGLSYDNILGFIPLNGILYRRFSENVIEFNVVLRNLFDFLSIPDLTLTDAMFDGTDTLIKFKYSFVESGILKDSTLDYISLRLNDDFSSFKEFRVSAGCKSRMEIYEQSSIAENLR